MKGLKHKEPPLCAKSGSNFYMSENEGGLSAGAFLIPLMMASIKRLGAYKARSKCNSLVSKFQGACQMKTGSVFSTDASSHSLSWVLVLFGFPWRAACWFLKAGVVKMTLSLVLCKNFRETTTKDKIRLFFGAVCRESDGLWFASVRNNRKTALCLKNDTDVANRTLRGKGYDHNGLRQYFAV